MELNPDDKETIDLLKQFEELNNIRLTVEEACNFSGMDRERHMTYAESEKLLTPYKEYLTKQIENGSGNANTYYYLGECYLRLDQAEKALEIRKLGYEKTHYWRLNPDGYIYDYEIGRNIYDGYGRKIRQEMEDRTDYWYYDGGKLLEYVQEAEDWRESYKYNYSDDGRCVQLSTHYTGVLGEYVFYYPREYGDGYYIETDLETGVKKKLMLDKYGRFDYDAGRIE